MDSVETIRMLYAEGFGLHEIIEATGKSWEYIQSCISSCRRPARRYW